METLIWLLAEIGLISADWKHRREIRKQEKADGIKRPIKMYLQSPTVIVFGLLLVLILVLRTSIRWYRDNYSKPISTKKEIRRISETIEKWKVIHGHLPYDMEMITDGRPLRKNWLTDSWNMPYRYTVDTNTGTFNVVSAGKNHVFGDNDDIKEDQK